MLFMHMLIALALHIMRTFSLAIASHACATGMHFQTTSFTKYTYELRS